MKYEIAYNIAMKIRASLQPYCHRVEIAGSIRRKKPEVGDIEIVLIPKPYEVGLFESGVATVINKFKKVKGELPCKYTQRIHPEGIKIDFFFAVHENWGYIFAIRTGSREFSSMLARRWVKHGYNGKDGFLNYHGEVVPLFEEIDLFNELGMQFVDPEKRCL